MATINTIYIGERGKSTIETYYVILNKAFNDLSDARLYTVLQKNRQLIILKAVLKGKITRRRLQWKECGEKMVLGLMSGHMMTQHGQKKRGDGVGKPRPLAKNRGRTGLPYRP